MPCINQQFPGKFINSHLLNNEMLFILQIFPVGVNKSCQQWFAMLHRRSDCEAFTNKTCCFKKPSENGVWLKRLVYNDVETRIRICAYKIFLCTVILCRSSKYKRGRVFAEHIAMTWHWAGLLAVVKKKIKSLCNVLEPHDDLKALHSGSSFWAQLCVLVWRK